MLIKSPNLFLHIPNSLHPTPKTSTTKAGKPIKIIFFITGNPGLIRYYHRFLSLLSQSDECRGCVIYGASLGGFEVDDRHHSARGEWRPTGPDGTGRSDDVEELNGDESIEEHLLWPEGVKHGEGELWGLMQQVELAVERLEGLVHWVRRKVRDVSDENEETGTAVEVTLMGHSVGAWIALEVRKVWCERYGFQKNDGSTGEKLVDRAENSDGEKGSQSPRTKQVKRAGPPYNIVGAVLLTPTIMELAKSPSGKVAMPLLSNLGLLPSVLQSLTTLLHSSLPESWLASVVSRVTGQAKGEGLETTVQFLQSDKGVKQALFLAKDELRLIREDCWSEGFEPALDIGSKADKSLGVTKLYFLFAREDHWVAQSTRAEIIRLRGGETGEEMGKTVVVDEEGLMHAWCLKQSEPVSKIVKRWLQEIWCEEY